MKLLLATGGSPHSEAALRLGAYIIGQGPVDEIPTVLTVIKDEMDQPQATKILTRAGDLMTKLGSLRPHLKIRVGQPAREIMAEAEAGHYDLIIIGERASHRFLTRFLGSTAAAIINKASCPVIVAKGQIGPLRRVLLCDSGANDPSVLSRFTNGLGGLLGQGVNICILHVMSQISAGPRVVGKQLRAGAKELIQTEAPEGRLLVRDMQALERLHIHSDAKIRHGLVVDEILEEARSGDYDLVVIGEYRGVGWEQLLLDNLARQIITKIDRPVLIVR